jgi:hypothetical protein
MTTDTLEMENRFTRIVGSESRSQSIAIRFTRDEASAPCQRRRRTTARTCESGLARFYLVNSGKSSLISI